MTLRLSNITKHYGSLAANEGIDLEVAPGELHGLLGENGAGKSTLMKVLSGFVRADTGTVELDGRTVDLSSPRQAIAAGIGMLHQDPLVFGPFSVLDNFLVGAPGRLDRRRGARELATATARYGFTLDPDATARSLTVGERQQLEIARLLWLGARVLIFDEPTTGISTSQREQLFAVLEALAADGLIVIFVSHKLEEVEQLCDRVTVMRRGRVVGREQMPVPARRLVELMFGEAKELRARADRPGRSLRPGPVSPAPQAPQPKQEHSHMGSARLAGRLLTDRPAATVGAPVLDVRTQQVSGPGAMTLEVAAGEVVGLAGLEGSGQRQLLRGCAGLTHMAADSLRIGGTELAGRPYGDFVDAGVHLLPAGRLEEGLVPGLTIAEHVELCSGRTSFVVDRAAADAAARTLIAEFSIKGQPDSPVESLSGGNQQRLLLAMMPARLRLLLMEHPTRGLDLESAAWVWGQLLERRLDGTGIVFASSDLDELLRYSDRIAVFFEGRIVRVVDARSTSPDELGHLIGGRVPSSGAS